MSDMNKTLRLTFHGRIIDHLGIQMYQSPVAAVAELISNAWDADADTVEILLPNSTDADAALIVKDNGIGMTFTECQKRFLNVGWCRRGDNTNESTKEKGRPVLGRKGIGKFAGFGIASLIQIETISKESGEKTAFELDLNQLRSDAYIQADGGDVQVIDYRSPAEERRREHGTSIVLKNLKIGRRIPPDQFARSMARRFLLHQRAHDFRVLVNDAALPEGENLERIEYVFPRDYGANEKLDGLREENGWGIETLTNGREIKWRVFFNHDPIDEEELRGVAIFSRGKLAQRPFFFNLTGGLGGQHGQEYMSGQVEADYIDELDEDIIATERQRINWEHVEAIPLQEWGQNRVKELLRKWHDNRGEDRRRQIEQKMAPFSIRLEKLPPHERQTVRRALDHVGRIPALSYEQFRRLGDAILQAWEQGRLRGLIHELADKQEVNSDWLLSALTEADVLVALNLAEAVKTKIQAIKVLEKLVEKCELENTVRDHIAEKPYLLHPRWETFRKEVSIRHIMDEAARKAGLQEVGGQEGQRKRIDLALRSDEQLLIVEFMRPGKRADYDHLSRCRRYVYFIRDKIKSETALGISRVTGLIVADRLEDDASLREEVHELQKSDILAYSWKSLLGVSTWKYLAQGLPMMNA